LDGVDIKWSIFNFKNLTLLQDSMNDSGYSSPPKRSQFLMKTKNSNLTADTFVARNGAENLGRVVLRKNPEMKLDNTLFLAKLRGHDGKIFWVPFSLPCGFIQMKTEIKWEEISGKVHDYVIGLDDTKPYSKPQSEPTKPSGFKLFFISLDRKYKTAITHVDYKKLGREVEVCVIASGDQTFKEALIKDGRFKNVERFTLNQKVEGGVGPIVDINDRPAVLPEELVLEVRVKNVIQSTGDKCSMPLNNGATVLWLQPPRAQTVMSTQQNIQSPRLRRGRNRILIN
jgi:hypothetical protein